MRAIHLCSISNPISETTFSYLNVYKQKQYFDQITCSLELPDMFRTYLTTSVLLSLCFSVGLELIFYDYLASKMRKEETTVSIEGLNSLEYYIKTYSQVILEFTELVQGLNSEKEPEPEKSPPTKKWTLRFSVRDVQGHESYLREGEHKNVEFINIVKNILSEDLIKPNNFQVPLFATQFNTFHTSLKKAYDRTLKGKSYDTAINNILTSFMQSNFDIFIENVTKTLLNLHAKYLGNPKGLFDAALSQANSMSSIFDLSDTGARSYKTEPVMIFELFSELMKHILGACTDKRIFFSVLNMVNELLTQIMKSFKESFTNEITDSHYLKQFDKTYYDYEKSSYIFRSIKYPFLYAPTSSAPANAAENSDISKLYSVFFWL